MKHSTSVVIVVVSIVVVFMTETSIDLHLIGSETAELNQVYNGNETKLNRAMKFEWFYAVAWSSEYEKRFGAKN